jgi:hypothetical protein
LDTTHRSAIVLFVTLGGFAPVAKAAVESAPDPAAPVGAPPVTPGAQPTDQPAAGLESTAPPPPERPVGTSPEPAAADAPPPLYARYNRGLELATAAGEFKARIGLYSQVRFESTRPTEPGSEFANHVYIPRTRLILDGNAFGTTNRYKLELSLGDKGSFGFIKDFYVDKNLGPLSIRFGQWKRPWERQEIVSDFAIQFNERTAVSDYAGSGRDLGFAIHNRYEQSPQGIEWAFGVFNQFSGGNEKPITPTTCTQATMAISCTTGTPTNVPRDWSPALVARAGWNSKGMKGYSESDLEGGPLRYAVAVGYKIDLANFSAGKQASKLDNMSHGLEADALIKISGFSLELEGFLMKLKSADATFGALAQAGMFVLPKQVELAAQVAVSPTTGDRKELELRGAVNWYWADHRWKLQTDIARLQQTGQDPTTMAKDDPDYQVRTMVQLTF